MKFLYLIFLSCLISCSLNTTEKEEAVVEKVNNDSIINITSINKSNYNPDTSYIGDADYFEGELDKLRLSNWLSPEEIKRTEIVKHRIKKIATHDCIKKFDQYGSETYWKDRTHSLALETKFEYNTNKQPVSLSCIIGDEELKCKFKYSLDGKLLQAGGHVLEYYPNGLLKSVESYNSIEQYKYDNAENLTHIIFKLQPRILDKNSSNLKNEWQLEYNKNSQLVRVVHKFPDGEDRFFTSFFEYSDTGQIIREIETLGVNSIASEDNILTIKEYTYINNLLTKMKKMNYKGNRLEDDVTFKYEFYK